MNTVAEPANLDTSMDGDDPFVDALSYAWPSGPYIPHKPTALQDAFLWLDHQEALFGGAAGGGKLLALDTPVPTPNGWTTMGELRKGDELFDESGDVCRVVIAHAVNSSPKSYRVTFDDGSQIDACADHRWLTLTAADLAAATRRTPGFRARRSAARPSNATGSRGPLVTALMTERNRTREQGHLPVPVGSIKTTREIAETLETKRGRRNHAVAVSGALDLPDAELPIDPYLLGVWLGDGTSASGAITTADPEIVRAFVDGEYPTRKRSGKYDYGTLGLSHRLRNVGVLRNKHVPSEYLRASRDQRLALLQGLMDSDGTCNKSGSVSFGNMNRQLVELVAELARSLGSKCAVNTRLAKLNGKSCGSAWLVKWTPDYPAFRLKRKLERQTLKPRSTTKRHYIVACERIKSVPMRCITVSSESGLFLAGESMIPTHNSDALLMSALQYCEYPDYSALILRKTFAELSLDGAIMDRSHKWLAHTDATWNGSHYRWTFPSGATLQFGYLKGMRDRARYQSAEYQCIECDELTAFEEGDYRFMFSRLRKSSDSNIPLRMRSATNPGGVGGKWVKKRFVDPFQEYIIARQRGEEWGALKRPFIPAKLSDNPHVDQESYRNALLELEPELIEMLLNGNWNAREPGNWMLRDPRYIDACEELGLHLWNEHTSGRARLPEPYVIIDKLGNEARGLGNCMDWGEHTQAYVIWNLPNGGIFIPPSEVVKIGADPTISTKAMMDEATRMPFPLVQSNYDAAGIQSMRTYLGVMRNVKRYERLRSMKIPFGDYKKETQGYLRTLARRSWEGVDGFDEARLQWQEAGRRDPDVAAATARADEITPWRILAVHPSNTELCRQLRIWRRKDEESDEAIKVDDHGCDALVAGAAPLARKFRDYIEQEIRDAYGQDEAYENDPDALDYEPTFGDRETARY